MEGKISVNMKLQGTSGDSDLPAMVTLQIPKMMMIPDLSVSRSSNIVIGTLVFWLQLPSSTVIGVVCLVGLVV